MYFAAIASFNTCTPVNEFSNSSAVYTASLRKEPSRSLKGGKDAGSGVSGSISRSCSSRRNTSNRWGP
jgi:hypothetical protein